MGWPFIVLVVHGILSFGRMGSMIGLVFFGGLFVILILYNMMVYYDTMPTELREMDDYLVANGYCGQDYYLLHESPFSSVPQQYYLRVNGCDATNILYSELSGSELNSAGGDVIDKNFVVSNLSFLDGKKVLYWNSGVNLVNGSEIFVLQGLKMVMSENNGG
jgi:hypothetical protein